MHSNLYAGGAGMNELETVRRPELFRNAESIIIAMGAAVVLGLIMIAQGRTTDKQFTHPMHSPNDRSRFATIRALGDNGTYAIGSVNEDGSYTEGSIVAEMGWDTIDKVRRPDDGQLYSSKPPLLPTVLAFEYMLLKRLPTFSYSVDEGWHRTGNLTFATHGLALVRTIVVTANWIPLVIYLVLFARLLGRVTMDPWIRTFTVATAAVGNYLIGFSVTLNNHTVAAFCSFFAIYAALRIWQDDRVGWWLFGVAGFFASLTAVLELPALALVAALGLALAWKNLGKCLVCFVPAAIIPIAGHCVTNYEVTGSIRPAYENKEWYVFEGSYWKLDPSGRLVGSSKDPVTGALVIGDPKGIDNQHEPWYVYLFHMWLGHHGVFSLSPVLILAAIGLVRTLREHDVAWMPLALLALGLTVLLAGFYTIGPAFGMGQRNYGGMCNGMRWLFWLIPMWLIFLPKGLEWKVNCPGFRFCSLVLLVISGMSALYASRNPWTRPWLQELLYQCGWLGY
jgi:hypothetical protein